MDNVERIIKHRLKVISCSYDIKGVVTQELDCDTIAKYYRASDLFYRLVHSRLGRSIHMGLSDDGKFHMKDFFKQAEYVARNFSEDTRNVLEIGAGMCMNTDYLARKYPDIDFVALDLPNRNFLKMKVPRNVMLVEGDYNNLSDFYGKFDLIYAVETLAHTENKSRVILELYKALKSSGKLIIFDYYNVLPFRKMKKYEKCAYALTMSAMKTPYRGQQIDKFVKDLKDAGFTMVNVENLTEKIRPSVKKLERCAKIYFQRPVLKILQKLIVEDATMNGITGYLMDLVFDGKRIGQYNRIVAVKL